MYEILSKKEIAPAIWTIRVKAERLAQAAQPGQFLIVVANEQSERIPLTICDYNAQEGTVTIVVQAIGLSTDKIVAMPIGSSFVGFVGPLGHASEFANQEIGEIINKRFLFVAGGLGAAPVYPQVKWLKEHGIEAHVILGAKNENYVILEDEFRALTPHVHVATDDGSRGFHGLVTALMKDLIAKGETFDQVIAIGPMIMMKFVALTTREFNIPTIVSLNTLMVDGTGMCGACRVTVAGKVRFACVEGPEFDGHLVDFDEAMRRMGMYKEQENHKCKIR
ncbi:MAG: sulfide/dihydroorotate dehydrogenase-like FAD/NAD-binding protein [Mucinivorans sp.]